MTLFIAPRRAFVRMFMLRALRGAALASAIVMGVLPGGVGSALAQDAQEQVIDRISIEGTGRIARATVLSYLELRQGDPVPAERIDAALKALYATGLFSDVQVTFNDGVLWVKVEENPIINRIAFEGNRFIEDDLLALEVGLTPRAVYTPAATRRDVQRILDLYQRNGRFSARVEPKIIEQPQNRVDVVFEVDEGPKTTVTSISFIGNRFFSDNALRGVLLTQESRWYRFFDSSDTYDPDRLAFDEERLRRLYAASGFSDMRVVSSVAELSEDRSGFVITITLEEGRRYRLGGYAVSSRIEGVDTAALEKELEDLDVGGWYNADITDRAVEVLTDALGDMGYAFAEVKPVLNPVVGTEDLSLVFDVREGLRAYVERINIRGNIRTKDNVIRREMRFSEGDAFNAALIRRSRQRIYNMGYFESVEVNTHPGSAPDQIVIDFDVVEQLTGALNLGAGFSSLDGATAEISLEEDNLGGNGQSLSLATSVGAETASIDLSFTEPYFMGRDVSAKFDIFRVTRERQSLSSYDSQETGFGVGLGYDVSEYWKHFISYQLSRESIENISDTASSYVKAQEGTNTTSKILQVFTYDRRNSSIDPTDGYMVSLSNDLAGLGGNMKYVKNGVTAAYYQPLAEEVYFLLGADFGFIEGLGDDIHLNDRYFVGGNNLRGFQGGGIGPRDISTEDALGGKQSFSGTVELRFPLGLPDELGVTGALFADAGYLSGVDESGSDVRDSGSVRDSVGVGLNWNSPFGPLALSLAKAIHKESYDKVQTFNMDFGTRF